VPVFSREGGQDSAESFISADDGSILTSAPLVDATFIDTKEVYYVGDYLPFKLKNCGYRYNDATWYITGPTGSTSSYKQSTGMVRLVSSGRYQVKVVTGQESIVTYVTVK
jgi:hypothetical protein